MNLLCVFAGQGYHDDDLFQYLHEHPESEKVLQELSLLIKIDLLQNRCSLKNPHLTQLFISTFQFTIFKLLAPLLYAHQVNLAGLSLGEVSAFLASVNASADELYKTIAFRTDLMTSIINQQNGLSYDLLTIRGQFTLADIHELCQQHHCAVSIIYTEQHLAIAGAVNNLNELLQHLAQYNLTHCHFLDIKLPSHSFFYAEKKGLFETHLNALFSKPLSYPILNPIALTKVYNQKDEKKLLDQEIYTPLPWGQLCALIPEYKYDLILDLGPGENISKQLKMMKIEIPVFTFANYSSIAGALTSLKKLIHSF